MRVAEGDPGALASVLWRARTGEMLLTTLAVTAATCAGCLVLGVATAWVLVGVRLPARRMWIVLACLPLAVPSFVAAFSWVALIPGLQGPLPLVGILIACTVPYVTVPAMAAFARVDGSLADTARTLGRGPVAAWFTVTLPQVLPAALAGTLLVALYALADFGAPALLRVQTLTTGIYSLFRGGFDRTGSAALSLVLVVIAVLCVAGEAWARRGDARHTAGHSRPVVPGRGASSAIMAALAVVGVAGIVIPLAVLVVRSTESQRYASSPQDLAIATVTTLLLGLASAVLVVVLALPISHLTARYPTAPIRAIGAASVVGHAVPGLVIALALVALSVRTVPGIYQSVILLVIAYAILSLPKSIGASRAAIAAVPLALEDASRTLGRGSVATWIRVTLRGAAPGILAGGVLVMTSVMKELPATLLLRPTGMETLATELWSRTSLGAFGAAAPAGVLLVVVGIVPALLMARSVRSMT